MILDQNPVKKRKAIQLNLLAILISYFAEHRNSLACISIRPQL